MSDLSCQYSTISSGQLMEKVIPDYQIDDALDCLFWERGANDTYQVRCPDVRYSLRLYRSGAFPREAIEFEAEVLTYLHQRDFPVAYPIARKSGEFLTEIRAPEGVRYALLSSFADGAEPDYESLDTCRLVGESVAQMHQLSEGFKSSRKRTPLDLQSLLEESIATMSPYLAHRPDDLAFIEHSAQCARDAVRAVPAGSLDYGICHGDLHGYNLHVHAGKVTHFDFEECAFGYRVYDLATFKWGVCMGEHRVRRWPAFMEGYESIRSVCESECELIDTFVLIRDLSNIAFGMRNIEDFGHQLVSEDSIDDLCKQLKHILESVRR